MKVVLASDLAPAREVPAPDLTQAYPLVLDLDGTLLRTDLLLEAALNFVKRRPLGVFLLLCWAMRGVAHLKFQLASRTDLAVALLPINDDLATYARLAAEGGRQVVVATAANHRIAEMVCGRFAFLSEVLASSDHRNLKGIEKARALQERFPEGYCYAGDTLADLPVWEKAAFGIFAGHNRSVLDRFRETVVVEAEFTARKASTKDWLRALRLHQWAKNCLIVAPLILAGQILDVTKLASCVAAFLAMGLTASATYILNDLLDLEADRAHWTKKKRPFASGAIEIHQGLAASICLLAAGLGLAAVACGLPVVGLLGAYCITTLVYSVHLKRVPVLDVAILAGLFTLRLVLGSAAAEVHVSAWLLVFSMFLFLSLALAKRSTEIGRTGAERRNHDDAGVTGFIAPDAKVGGRGYIAADIPLVAGLGVSAAMAAVQVMVLYLINDAFSDTLYAFPQVLWVAPVAIGLWLGRVWLLCGRGLLNDDPVVFAVSDRISLTLGACVAASFAGAALIS